MRSIDMHATDEQAKLNQIRISKGSVMNQVLRQCNFRKGVARRQNFSYALSKQKAMQSMRDEIKNYANLSSIQQESNYPNSNTNIAKSYVSPHRFKNNTIDM